MKTSWYSRIKRMFSALRNQPNPSLDYEHLRILMNTSSSAKTGQISLMLKYKALLSTPEKLPRFNDAEFRAFSQNGEDGLLLYIFSLIGTTNKKAIEICAGDGMQCNTANLILNHNWNVLLVEGNNDRVKKGNEFYRKHQDTFSFPPCFVNAWVNKNSVNKIFIENDFTGEIDLLSIDLDGVDYWIWDAIDVVKPRVVVAEIQCIWGVEKSVTVPYKDDFRTQFVDGFGIYSGASLPAFAKLARQKGYRLVGVQNLGFNAFFIKEDICKDLLPEVSAEECLDRPFVYQAKKKYLPLVRDKKWVEV
jgi:hypothetical protein